MSKQHQQQQQQMEHPFTVFCNYITSTYSITEETFLEAFAYYRKAAIAQHGVLDAWAEYQTHVWLYQNYAGEGAWSRDARTFTPGEIKSFPLVDISIGSSPIQQQPQYFYPGRSGQTGTQQKQTSNPQHGQQNWQPRQELNVQPQPQPQSNNSQRVATAPGLSQANTGPHPSNLQGQSANLLVSARQYIGMVEKQIHQIKNATHAQLFEDPDLPQLETLLRVLKLQEAQTSPADTYASHAGDANNTPRPGNPTSGPGGPVIHGASQKLTNASHKSQTPQKSSIPYRVYMENGVFDIFIGGQHKLNKGYLEQHGHAKIFCSELPNSETTRVTIYDHDPANSSDRLSKILKFVSAWHHIALFCTQHQMLAPSPVQVWKGWTGLTEVIPLLLAEIMIQEFVEEDLLEWKNCGGGAPRNTLQIRW